MKETTISLCEKFTDLTEKEILFLEKYSKKLQALSDAHQLDVFIDCRSLTGRTAIVVAEAKPSNGNSLYTKSLIGMLVSWQNEPAVDRSFRLGVPTTGVKAYSVPEEMSVVQNVFPLFFKGKMLAALIYEKKFKETNEPSKKREKCNDNSNLVKNVNWLFCNVPEAVLLVDHNEKIFECNEAAKILYKQLGYVDDLQGMSTSNIIPEIIEEIADNDHWGEVTSGNIVYQYKKVNIKSNVTKYALIVKDITQLRNLEKEQKLHLVEMSEFRHRIKNNLQFLCGFLNNKRENETNKEIQTVLCDISAKINTIEAGLEEEGYGYCSKVSLSNVLKRIREKVHSDFMNDTNSIQIEITGRDVKISAEKISSVALIVNELLRNAMKHAFNGRKSGKITINQEKIIMLTKITIADNGTGFDPHNIRQDAAGLKLAQTIVREKLGGEIEIETDIKGTVISFNFIE
ncbi:MAG: sensor histidine kinase [Synergistaceae bacterium]